MNPALHITQLTQPERGAVVAAYCRECRVTIITVSEYAAKPADGDYWYLEGFCSQYYWHGLKAVPRRELKL